MRPRPKPQPDYPKAAPRPAALAGQRPARAEQVQDWDLELATPSRQAAADSGTRDFWSSLAVVGTAVLGFGGLLAGLAYFGGLPVAAAAAAIATLLVAWGNWILDNTIDL